MSASGSYLQQSSLYTIGGADDVPEPVGEQPSLFKMVGWKTLFTPLMLWLMSCWTMSAASIGSIAVALDEEYGGVVGPHLGAIAGIVFLGGILGQPAAGALGDAKGRRIGLLAMMAIQAAGHAIYLFWTGSPEGLVIAMYLGRFLAGFGGAGCNPLTLALAAEGTDNPAVRGLRCTITCAMLGASSMVIPIFGGILGEANLSYNWIWRLVFGGFIFPFALALPGVFKIKESDAWLRIREAKKAEKAANKGKKVKAPKDASTKMFTRDNTMRLIYGCVLYIFLNANLYGVIIAAPQVAGNTLGSMGSTVYTSSCWGAVMLGTISVVAMGSSLPFMFSKPALWNIRVGYGLQTIVGIVALVATIFTEKNESLGWLTFVLFAVVYFTISFLGALITFGYVPVIFPLHVRALFTAICLSFGLAVAFGATIVYPMALQKVGVWCVILLNVICAVILFGCFYFVYYPPVGAPAPAADAAAKAEEGSYSSSDDTYDTSSYSSSD